MKSSIDPRVVKRTDEQKRKALETLLKIMAEEESVFLKLACANQSSQPPMRSKRVY
jgi:hypothetical protein